MALISYQLGCYFIRDDEEDRTAVIHWEKVYNFPVIWWHGVEHVLSCTFGRLAESENFHFLQGLSVAESKRPCFQGAVGLIMLHIVLVFGVSIDGMLNNLNS